VLNGTAPVTRSDTILSSLTCAQVKADIKMPVATIDPDLNFTLSKTKASKVNIVSAASKHATSMKFTLLNVRSLKSKSLLVREKESSAYHRPILTY